MTRRLAVLVAAVALVAAGCGSGGQATARDSENYPRKNIKLIIPQAAGGPTDLAGRVMSDCFDDKLGAQVIVENKDGGAGAIGTGELARSDPDGYTLGVGTIGTLIIAPLLSTGAGYTKDDITPIAKLYQIPSAVVVRADSEFQTAEQFFQRISAAPGGVSVGVGGASTVYALELKRLQQEYGLSVNVVPFKGAAPALTALLGGNLDATFEVITSDLLQRIRAGELRALASGESGRIDFLPDVPSVAELGYPKLTGTTTFFALVGPRGLPADIRAKLEGATETCLADDAVRQRLGQEYVPSTLVATDEIRKELDTAAGRYEGLLQ
jgi:tripartite-type tricarboxylate transporter receptor subunit TctC